MSTTVPTSAAGRSSADAKTPAAPFEWRQPGEPGFGGHIERQIRTEMGRLHLLPGTTFSNEQDLGDYASKPHTALTLRELERHIALDIVGSYHQSIHRGLGRPPIAVWRDHEGEVPLRLLQDLFSRGTKSHRRTVSAIERPLRCLQD